MTDLTQTELTRLATVLGIEREFRAFEAARPDWRNQ